MSGKRPDIRLFPELGRTAQRGSKPRCHLLVHGSANDVARRLTDLAAPFAEVRPDDRWMPDGFRDVEEAQLHKALGLLESALAAQLQDWWLASGSEGAKTPNFDIAGTCSVSGRPGLLLIEAKAHDDELAKEAAGRKVEPGATDARAISHKKIGEAIEAARCGLHGATKFECNISRDSHYQMSNRFAWAWKLAAMGVPVVLIYLGFLNSDEMKDKGRPFKTKGEWEALVRTHSAPLFGADVWNRRWLIGGQAFIPLIRAVEQPLLP